MSEAVVKARHPNFVATTQAPSSLSFGRQQEAVVGYPGNNALDHKKLEEAVAKILAFYQQNGGIQLESVPFEHEQVAEDDGADCADLLHLGYEIGANLDGHLGNIREVLERGFVTLGQKLDEKVESLAELFNRRLEQGTPASDMASSEQLRTVEDLLTKLFRERLRCVPNHLRDRLLMIRKAYAMLYGLMGISIGRRSWSNPLNCLKLSLAEQGKFVEAEFERLNDAFEFGLGVFRASRESPTTCAVQRSTYVALLYVLARAICGSTEESWRKCLTLVSSFLMENAVFYHSTSSQEALKLRAVLSRDNLRKLAESDDTALQRHIACALLLQRWKHICRQIPQPTDTFSFHEPFPLLPYWNGVSFVDNVPNDLREVAGPIARAYGRSVVRQSA
jgi:hypothetical protein